MLRSLRLESFRGFAEHTLTFRDLTIIVGRNNAGKSTIVEALRLVATITRRFGALNFHPVPSWLNAPRLYRGVKPDIDRADFDFATVLHRYEDGPAVVRAEFTNGCAIQIYLGGEQRLHAVVFDEQGRVIPDKAQARRVSLPRVAILPQIGPLPTEEQLLNDDYVRRTIDTPLASLHFRNQLKLDQGAYRRFREMVEQTWPGVRVYELRTQGSGPTAREPNTRFTLSLLIQNDDFVAEVSRMGHGLQMWLQTMWFLARAAPDSTVILDEPDVYMHPDLQRRLVRLVQGRHAQAIIATHSTEIVSDVSPDSILVVDRARPESRFAGSVPEVQQIIESLGAVQNVHLARLWSAGRFLIVEGDDVDILGPVHAMLFPESLIALQNVPRGEAGGWGGWERAIGAAQAMRRAFGDQLQVYCLFDADYRPLAPIEDRYRRASRERIHLHVWGVKEVENFLLVPAAISRIINLRSRRGSSDPEAVAVAIDQIVDGLQREVTSAIIDNLHALDRPSGPGNAYKLAEEWRERAWVSREGRWALVSGKRVLSLLSSWAQATYGVSLNSVAVARALNRDEIAPELVRVLAAIERGRAITLSDRQDATMRAAP